MGKALADYQIASVKVQTSASAAKGYFGGVNTVFYDKEEDIAKWSGKLVPYCFVIQPVLCPVDPYVQAEVQVEDEAANGAVIVDCYGLEERGGE